MCTACFGVSQTPIERQLWPLGTRHSGIETETISVIHDNLRIHPLCAILYVLVHKHHIYGINLFWCIFQKTLAMRAVRNCVTFEMVAGELESTSIRLLHWEFGALPRTSANHKTYIIHTEVYSVTKITTSNSAVYVNVQTRHAPGIKYWTIYLAHTIYNVLCTTRYHSHWIIFNPTWIIHRSKIVRCSA